MKFLSFRAGGAARYGVVDGNNVVDLTRRLKYPDLRALLEADARAEAERAAKGATADFTLDQIAFDPVIPNPPKIHCLGLNYDEHINETGLKKFPYPTLFVRFADSQIGHLQPIIKPKLSDKVDYEGELAVIIGKGGRYISEADAYSHVAGYSCYNDVSIRDYQNHASQWTPGKNFPTSGPFGPWMVTQDEMGELAPKQIQTRVNGKQVQSAKFSQMIFPVPKFIEYISRFTSLAPGDVIVSGTPGGVGYRRDPPLWMKAGDNVEIEIEGIGILKNSIVAET